MSSNQRPTKKQFQLLEFIDGFIKKHGYSPSYREIMRGCNYNSVATVALHVNNLVARGHLQKRDNSARSLEVVNSQTTPSKLSAEVDHLKKLVQEVEQRFARFEKQASEELLDEIYVLVGALKVLGHHDHAYQYAVKLSELR